MKTYTEVLNKLAEQAFSRYMQGEFFPTHGINTEMVAFIFERDLDEVSDALNTVYEHKKSAYYESVNG